MPEREIQLQFRTEPRERVLRGLTAAEAAETGRWASLQGEYRLAAAWHQLAGAIEATELDRAVGLARQQPALTETTRQVPIVRPPMRDERPRTAQCTCATPLGVDEVPQPCPEHGWVAPATEVIERPVSHAPTTCTFLVTYYSSDGEQQHPCGELIRWEIDKVDVRTAADPGPVLIDGRGRWVHHSDKRLGTMPHPATPGQ